MNGSQNVDNQNVGVQVPNNNVNQQNNVNPPVNNVTVDAPELGSVSSSDDAIPSEQTLVNTITLKGKMCKDCNMKFSDNANTSQCVFCGSSNIVDFDTSEDETHYIPFVKTYNDAIADYKKKTRFKFLLPFTFKNKKTRKRIVKAFFPVKIYDAKVYGKIVFYAADEIIDKKNTEVKQYEVSYDTNFDYNNVLVSSCSKIDESNYTNVFKYDYSQMTVFNNDVLGDALHVYSDVDDSVDINKLNEKIVKNSVNIVRGSIGHELKKLKENNMSVLCNGQKKILVPMYVLNIKYKNNDYFYLMNGQSGESFLNIEISKTKIVVVSLLIFTLIFLVIMLIAFFF